MGLSGGYFEFSAAHPQKEIPAIICSGFADFLFHGKCAHLFRASRSDGLLSKNGRCNSAERRPRYACC